MEHTELVRKCQMDNIEGFNELYKLYAQKAYRTACFIAGNTQVAEDIVQEAFTQCFFEIKNLKNPELFNSWFYSILVRLGWKISGKCKKVLSNETSIFEMEFFRSNENTEDLLLRKETHEKVNEALQKLNITLRTTVILYYYNQLSIKEISEIMNCFQGTVKSRLHTARKLIGKALDSYMSPDISVSGILKRGV